MPLNFSHKKIAEFVIGFSDGLIITTIVIIILDVLSFSYSTIINAGLLSTLAGMLLLGLGAYFSADYRKQRLLEKSEAEQKELNEKEVSKTIQLFRNLGLGEDLQSDAAGEIEKDSNEWKSYLEKYAVPPEFATESKPLRTFIFVALSYAAGGMSPILLWTFFFSLENPFIGLFASNVVCLFIFGLIKSKINKEPVLQGALRIVFIGAVSMLCAYAVANIFVR